MIYITGDMHGDYRRLSAKAFPEQTNLSKRDCVIVCGDFGIWNDSPRHEYWLDWLERRPFTTIFVTGNHDNYDLLRTFPVSDYCGGKAQLIRPSVIHLMRGQIFTLESKRFFTMGGASCHDIPDGVLSPDDPNFASKRRALDKRGAMYRIEHLSWWKEELPSDEEYQTAWGTLEQCEYAVDYILTHCPPESIRLLLEVIGARGYPGDRLTTFLEEVKNRVAYRGWYFGHYHGNAEIIENHHLVFDRMQKL